MKEITMEQIIAFNNSGDFLNNMTLPLKVAYKLNKIKKAVATEGEFYTTKFQEIVDKFAKRDENGNIQFSDDGNQILIKDGMLDECEAELSDLQNLTVQIDNYNLSIEDFGDDLSCTPEELEAIMPFLNE